MSKQEYPLENAAESAMLGAQIPVEAPVARRESFLRTYCRSKVAVVAAIYTLLTILCAAIAPTLLGKTAVNQHLSLRFAKPFNLDHGFLYVLGGDALGRSILARILVGAWSTLIVAALAVAFAGVIGFSIGVVSGFRGGWVDAVVMRLGDIILAFPALLIALAVLYVMGGGILPLIGVLAVARLPVYIRTARAQTLEIKERVFVDAARSLGAGPINLVVRQISPLVIPTTMTIAVLDVAVVMLSAAGLSFLGVGLQPPTISWGQMISEGGDYLTAAWWVTVFPGLAILLTAMALNLVSNHLRAMTDPKQLMMRLSIRS